MFHYHFLRNCSSQDCAHLVKILFCSKFLRQILARIYNEEAFLGGLNDLAWLGLAWLRAQQAWLGTLCALRGSLVRKNKLLCALRKKISTGKMIAPRFARFVERLVQNKFEISLCAALEGSTWLRLAWLAA